MVYLAIDPIAASNQSCHIKREILLMFFYKQIISVYLRQLELQNTDFLSFCLSSFC